MDGKDLMKWAARLEISLPTLGRAGVKAGNTTSQNVEALHKLSELHGGKKTRHQFISETAFDMATELEKYGEVDDE